MTPDVTRRSLCALVLAATATISWGGCLGSRARPVGSSCSGDGECASGLYCRYGRCRPECLFDRDCGDGQACVRTADGMLVCTVDDEGASGTGGCPPGLARDLDGICRESCDDGVGCPPGRRCADLGDGSVCVPSCNGPTVVQDDFESATLDPGWWPYRPTGGLGLDEGRLVVTPDPNLDVHAAWGVVSDVAIDLRGSWVAAEVAVPQPLRDEARATAFFDLDGVDGESSVGFNVAEGDLLAHAEGPDFEDGMEVLPYTEATPRWWRVREEEGTVYWELSDDGVDWGEPVFSHPVPARITAALFVNLGVSVGPLLSDPTDDEWWAEFHGVNVDPSADGAPRAADPFCPVSLLRDDFEGTEPDLLWETYEEGQCEVRHVDGGAVQITDSAAPDDREMMCLVASAHGYDLGSDAVTVRFCEPPVVPSGTSLYFEAWDRRDDNVTLTLVDGSLWAEMSGLEMPVEPYPYLDETHWRIRAAEDTVSVEISADGELWHEVADLPLAIDLDGVRLEVGVSGSGAPEGPLEVCIDSINVP